MTVVCGLRCSARLAGETWRASGTARPALARWLLGLRIAATLAANVAHGLGHGLTGAVVGAWPAVALVGSYELLMMVIRSSQAPAGGASASAHDADPLQAQASGGFAGKLAGDEGPSAPAIPGS